MSRGKKTKNYKEALGWWPKIKTGMAQDLTKIIIGDLTPVYRTKNLNRHTRWVCKCKCGNYTAVLATHLTQNKTKSCGCWGNKQCQQMGKNNAKDYSGIKNKDGLILIEPTDKRCGTHIIWKVKTPTGKIIETTPMNIIHNNVSGCGRKSSKGEFKIKNLLEKMNIEYIQEYSFKNCISDKNYLLRFDFYLPDYNCCIEYDGEQHYKSTKGWGGKEGLKTRQQRDSIKNQYCLDNNIKLIRIPYTEYDEINEKYLKERIGF